MAAVEGKAAAAPTLLTMVASAFGFRFISGFYPVWAAATDARGTLDSP